jgi:hypothetical protein
MGRSEMGGLEALLLFAVDEACQEIQHQPGRRCQNHQGQQHEGVEPGAQHNGDQIDAEHVSFLISELEKNGKGVPVLIRHYLKLNAKFLSFSVDKRFSNVVDGLIFVDLNTTAPHILKRFMGEQGLRLFAEAQARRGGLGTVSRSA